MLRRNLLLGSIILVKTLLIYGEHSLNQVLYSGHNEVMQLSEDHHSNLNKWILDCPFSSPQHLVSWTAIKSNSQPYSNGAPLAELLKHQFFITHTCDGPYAWLFLCVQLPCSLL